MSLKIEKTKKFVEYLKSNREFLDMIEALGKDCDRVYEELDKKQKYPEFNEYWVSIHDICKKFGISFIEWKGIIHNMVFYNQWDSEYLIGDYADNIFGVCKMSDWIIEGENGRRKILHKIENESFEKEFPVVLTINAYAKKQEVIDFIRENFDKKILPELKKNRDPNIKPFNSFRINNLTVRERDEFILRPEHENLSAKKLSILVNDAFKDREGYKRVSYPLINKIRSNRKNGK